MTPGFRYFFCIFVFVFHWTLGAATETGSTGAIEQSASVPLVFDEAAAIAAAERDFPGYLDAAWKSKTDYGFRTDDDQADVSLASPIPVFALRRDAITPDRAPASIVDILEPAGEWIFPVQAQGAYRTLFGVRLTDKGWKAVYLGNPYIAKALQELRAAWNANGADDFRLISSFHPRAFLFSVPGSAQLNLTPLTAVVDNGQQYFLPPSDLRALVPYEKTIATLFRYWEDSGEISGDQ